jgi:hypothetical protein
VDGLPIWVRWIIVFVVGLSPILIFWLAGILRRKLRARLRSGYNGLRHPRLAREVKATATMSAANAAVAIATSRLTRLERASAPTGP